WGVMRNRQRRNPMKNVMSPETRVVRDRYLVLEYVRRMERTLQEMLDHFPIADSEKRAVEAAQNGECVLTAYPQNIRDMGYTLTPTCGEGFMRIWRVSK